jgi:broad specificity phosphatase PhoE
MRATEILLLRHGQSEGNQHGRFGGHGPTPLTALGHAQAAATARTLAAEGLSAIYSSDLIRAVDTARPIAEATGLTIQQTAGLRERSVGVFTGLTFSEAEARYPEAFAALMRRESNVCPPEGETHGQASLRALAVLDKAVARFPQGRTLLVSHALTLYLVLLHVLGIEHATHAHKLFIRTDNCALHRLRRTPEGLWTVMALNDKSHLRNVSDSPVDEV